MPETQHVHKTGQPMWSQLISLSREQDKTLTNQLRRALVTAILDGHIPRHRPLPSPRKLSDQLGVARNTVVIAYRHLMDEEYLVSEERRGYFVNSQLVENRLKPTSKKSNNNVDQVDWESKILNPPSKQRNLDNTHSDLRNYDYSFSAGQPDPAMFPLAEWRECCRETLAVQAIGDWLPDSVDKDDPLLLEQIQNRLLPSRGLWVSRDEILITMGAQNALYMLARLLVKPGDKVGIENPGYPDARHIFENRNCELIPLDVDEYGLVVDDRINQCDVVFCTPSHQSPTSVTMSLKRRHELLNRASEHDFLVIEDDYESELNFTDTPLPALHSLDSEDRVIYIGSLSKTLAPGLRLGYMIGSKLLVNEARALRRLMLRHPPSNNQSAVAHFLALGHHDSLLHRVANTYKHRWVAMDKALGEYMPESQGARAFGGSAFWVKLPDDVDADAVQQKASENGILVTSGNAYYMDNSQPQPYLRLGISSITAADIPPGIKKLAALLDQLAS